LSLAYTFKAAVALCARWTAWHIRSRIEERIERSE